MRPAPVPPPSIPLVARTAALVGAGAAIAFLLILASLHVLRPDLDPTWRVISEYALGPCGWIMQAAFFALALATASLGVAAYAQARTLGGYLGLVLLLVTAIGMVLWSATASLAAAGSNPPLVGCGIWRGCRCLVFVVSAARLLSVHDGVFGPDVRIGIPNRLLIVTHCVWSVLAAGYLLLLPTAERNTFVAA